MIGGDDNTISGNEIYGCEGHGLNLKGTGNQIDDNMAHDNAQSGFHIGGGSNELTGNTAYNNDWDEEDGFQGGGFEISGAANTLDDNTAYGNTNGFYIEGPIPESRLGRVPVFGNTFTNNHAYDNLVGLNFIDNNGTYTDNTLEENYEADMIVGGDAWLTGEAPLTSALRTRDDRTDWTLICNNTVEDNTGSGRRDIFYAGETVTLTGGTYSEVLLCNAVNSVITGVTVDGSNTLDNNGMLLILSNGTDISDSKSQNNFMGYGFMMSSGASLTDSNSDGSGFGIFSQKSMDLAISGHVSKNNRMNATIILDLLMGFMGAPLTGEDTLRAPPADFPEMGAGAVLFKSPRATIMGSSFSGSTFGLALIRSDEVTVTGGTAYMNDVFGYGLLDSYNINFDGTSSAYENAGDIYDIFGEKEIPPQYALLQFLPFGVGVLDTSLNLLLPVTTARGEPLRDAAGCQIYFQCDVDKGIICDFDTFKCVKGEFENTFSGMRIYENHYGMVLFNLGHEVVDGCRVYDNDVLGLLDASNPAPFESLAADEEVPNLESVTIQNSYFYRNGEDMFSVLSELFDEGGMPAWAEALAFFDAAIPAGVLEMEIIEASYLNRMLPLGAPEHAGVWKLQQTTVGTGDSSVRMSLEDNATAIYLIHDTTLPTLDSIHMENIDFGVNMTLYLDIDDSGVGPRVPYGNKYFTIAALTESRDDLGAPPGPAIDEFSVHYKPMISGYDPETMGLYYLNILDMYPSECDEDPDCLRGEVCSEYRCIVPECLNDTDCVRDDPYCVDYSCVQCREDTDCSRAGECANCNTEKWTCSSNPICLNDLDCIEGCSCEEKGPGRFYCMTPTLDSAEGSCGASTDEAPIDDYVVLRAGTIEEQELIIKARWTPVKGQINDLETHTITVMDLTQSDRSAFLDMIMGSLPPEIPELDFYFDIYGLFAVRDEQPTGRDDEPEYVCEEDVDCPECYYCSIDNDECLPKSNVECGVPGTGCSEGYECEDCECVKEEEPIEEECTSDRECAGNEYCDDGECKSVPCECGEVKDHECFPFECCSDEECGELVCENNKCVEPEEDEGCDECDEPIDETEKLIDEAKDEGKDTSVVDELLGKAKEAKEKGDCEEALKYANAALAAAADLLGEDEAFSTPVISTEVPSVDQPQLPNGKEVTEAQQNIFWLILILLGLALVGYWWFRNHYGK
ncbi:MAG: hypothetical protein GY852_07830 [bacterium]|nr:hypothetical protein [bacterium]